MDPFSEEGAILQYPMTVRHPKKVAQISPTAITTLSLSFSMVSRRGKLYAEFKKANCSM